ncbi:MAG: SH3 domain-containing protein [Thermomicrobiales bacterium]
MVVGSLLMSMIAVVAGAPPAIAQDGDEALPAGGPVVVVLNNQASFRGASVTEQLDVEPTQVYDTIFNGFAADLDGAQIAELSQNPQVAAIVPDVTFYGDADYPPSIARAGLQDYVSGGGSGASIAIIDSGIAPHSALNIAGGYNCMGGDTNAWGDNAGHGTHVAGIAGATGGSSIGSAPGASLWAVKVLDGSAGSNPSGTLSTVLCGLNWVAANAGMVDAANMSLTTSGSGATSCSDASDPLHGAICAVVNAGVPIVAAAGNSSATGGIIPAAYPEVISVASLTDYNGMPGGGASKPSYCPGTNDGPDDTISGFSNYGALAELAAPGACIISTYLGGGYAYLSGTSMASPLVTGVVANYIAGGGGDPLGWLLSSATMSQSSAAGYSGAKSAGPVLYLSSTVVTPTPSGTTTVTATTTTTATITAIATGTATRTPTATATTTATSTTTATIATTLTATATATATGTPSASATATATRTPTATASPTRTLAPTVAPTANPGTGRITGTGGDGVNCRVGPGTGYGVITVLPEGATVTLNGSAANGWQPVICGGRAGYVSTAYITVVTPPSTATPTPTRTPTVVLTATATRTPTRTATIGPSVTPSITPTRTPTGIATATRTPSPTVAPTASPGTGRVSGTGGGGVNCRTGPGTSYSVIVVLPEGATVPLRGTASGGWQPVTCGGTAGWVSSDYITIVTQPSTATPAPTRTPTVAGPTPTRTPTSVVTPTSTPTSSGTGRITGTGGIGVNCRSGAGTGYSVITVLTEGATVPLRGNASGGWQPVTCGGTAGWVSSDYITIVSGSGAPTVVPSATTTATGTATETVAPTGTPSATSTEIPSPTATLVPTETATTIATATPTLEPTSTATPEPTSTATASPEPTDTSTPEPTATTTLAPTDEPSATASENAMQVGTVTGTGGDGVVCRSAASSDGAALLTLPEGAQVPVTGPPVDGWVPVTCADGAPGYVSADFLAIADASSGGIPTPDLLPTLPSADETVTAEPTVDGAGIETAEPTAEVATEEVAEEPTATPSETPLPIANVSDSEQSGAGWSAVDNDPATSWTVWPSLSPTRVTLEIDLGTTQPVDHLTLETDAWNTLPYTEIWLSDDGVTWWNVTQIDGASLQPDVPATVPLGYWTRFVMVVVPHADQTGLASFGGIRQIDLWATPNGDALPLTAFGVPVTPEPEPTQPVEEISTDVPVEETAAPVETVAPVETEVPSETVETPVDGGEATVEATAP